MGGRVDPAGEAGSDDVAGMAETVGKACGQFCAGGGCIARADDGDQRPGQHLRLAAHRQQRRRIVGHSQPRRIGRLAKRDELDTARPRSFQFGGCGVLAADPDRSCGAAAAGEAGQRSERRACAALSRQQGVEGMRSDMVAADEAQPVQSLLVAQLDAATREIANGPHGASIAQAPAPYNPK